MDIVLNNDSTEPIYSQLYKQITSQILNGSIKAGTQLPPIRAISNQLKISVIPVKMTWEMLDKEGFIKTITGKGTFVADITQENLKSKINNSAVQLAKETAEKAKTLGLSFTEFCNYLKDQY